MINRLEDVWVIEHNILSETSAMYRVNHCISINQEDFLIMIIPHTYFEFQKSTVQEVLYNQVLLHWSLINRLEDIWLIEYNILTETSITYGVNHYTSINRGDFLIMIITHAYFEFQRSTVQESTVFPHFFYKMRLNFNIFIHIYVDYLINKL